MNTKNKFRHCKNIVKRIQEHKIEIEENISKDKPKLLRIETKIKLNQQ